MVSHSDSLTQTSSIDPAAAKQPWYWKHC